METGLALVYWLHLLVLALWIGALAVLQIVLRGVRRVRPEDVRLLERARRSAADIAQWSVVVLILTLAAEIGLSALLAADGDVHTAFSLAGMHALLFGSRYGLASVARWLLLVVSLLVVGESRLPAPAVSHTPRRNRHALGIVADLSRVGARAGRPSREAWMRLAMALAAAVLLCTAIAGPYGTTPLAAIVEALHLGATALWFGGAVVVALTVLRFSDLVEPRHRPLTVLKLLDRFALVAILSAVVLLATGLIETIYAPAGIGSTLAGGSSLALVGRAALAFKTVLVPVIVALGTWSALEPRPRLRRLVRRLRRNPSLVPAVERAFIAVRRLASYSAVLSALVLLCGAAANAAYPASGLASAPRPTPLLAVGRAGSVTVSLRVDPGTAGLDTFDVRLTAARGAAVNGATVLIAAQSQRDSRTTVPTLTAAGLGRGRYRGRGTLAVDGPWAIRVSLRTNTVMAAVVFTLTVAPSVTPLPTPAPVTPAATHGGTAPSERWRLLGPAIIARALVADPADPSQLYEGTVAGIYRSTDQGQHWEPASSGLAGAGREVQALSALPDGSLVAATGDGVYRSTDGAQHWSSAGLHGRSIYTLATHLAGHIIILAGGDGGIFRSDDDGTHWHPVYSVGAAAVTSLAWPSARPTLIVAGVDPGPDSVIVSLDGGATWQVQRRGLPADAGMMSVAVAPGAQIVYAGSMGRGVYVSVGPSGSWQARNSGLPGLATGDAHVGAFAFLGPPGIIYAATDYGVYRSGDGGLHWAPLGQGLSNDAQVVTSLTLVPGAPPILYAATAGGMYHRPVIR